MVLWLTVALVSAAARAADGEAIRYRMADAHLHLFDFLQQSDGIEQALAAMDRAGVEHAMVSGMPLVKKWGAAEPRRPLYYLENDSRTYWYSLTDALVALALQGLPPAQQQRLHPFISGFNATDPNAVDHVERMLALFPGVWEGIGEVMTRHDDLTALTYGETARADHLALEAVYGLAAQHDLPVSIHSNIGSVWLQEPIYLHELEGAVKKHPHTRSIWAHAGISRRITIPTLTTVLEQLLSTYTNLWIDLSWVVFDQAIAPNGQLNRDWVVLIEKFPDRFMIGSDAVGHFHSYSTTITRYYLLLDALSPQTAGKVARENFLGVLPQRVRMPILVPP